MGKVYSHLSEEERQVIQIEVGNVLPAVPAEASEDGPVDGPVSHRRLLRFPAAGRR